MANNKFVIDLYMELRNKGIAPAEAIKQLKELGTLADKPKEVNLKTDDAQKEIKSLKKEIEGIGNSLESAFAVGKIFAGIALIKGAFSAIKGSVNWVYDLNKELVVLNNKAQIFGMSTNSLKAWETSFKAIGLEAQDADNALGSIQDRLLQQMINPSLQVASAFAVMGVNIQKNNGELKNTEDILLEVGRSFKKMNLMSAYALGGAIGLSKQQVFAMRNNPDFAKELAKQKNNLVVTQAEVRGARKGFVTQTEAGAEIDKVRYRVIQSIDSSLQHIQSPLDSIAQSLSSIVGVKDIGKTVFDKGVNALGLGQITDKAKAMGMTPKEVDIMQQVIRQESGNGTMLKNPKSSASGLFGFTDKTLSDLGETRGQDGESRAFKKLINKFEKIAKNKNIDINAQQYMAYHHLGETAYSKYIDTIRRTGKPMTYQQAYGFYGKKLEAQAIHGNEGMLNKYLPVEGLSGIPHAGQSPSVNNTINNSKVSNTNATTTIGTMNVNADNPKEFSQALRQSNPYLSRAVNLNGQYA